MRTKFIEIERDDMVVCESADGWSLHMPGATDEEIASGDAPYLASGAGKVSDADYDEAGAALVRKEAPWASKWAWMEGGIRAWESITDYETAMRQV